MAGERSAIVSEWFGASEKAQPFWDYIAHFRALSRWRSGWRVANRRRLHAARGVPQPNAGAAEPGQPHLELPNLPFYRDASWKGC